MPLLHRRHTAGPPHASNRVRRGVIARTQGSPFPLDHTQFTAITSGCAADILSTAGRYTIAEGNEAFLRSGEVIRPYLMGYEDFTFTTAAAPNTHVLTLSGKPIRSTRAAPTLPSSAHPDMLVEVTSNGAGVAAGTYLPVTVFTDGSTAVTIDTSSLTASTSVTVRAYYMEVGGTFNIQIAAPVGQQQRTVSLFSGGTASLYKRDPTKAGNAITVPFRGGKPTVLLPRYWQVNLQARYPHLTPTLTNADVLIPAAVSVVQYVDAGLETSLALQALGMG